MTAMMLPRGAVRAKPPHGQPCNRCGLCCVALVCPLGQHVLRRGPAGPCPALERGADGLSVCGLAASPSTWRLKATVLHGVEAMRRAALLLIGADQGCDAAMDGEPRDPAFYDRMREARVKLRDEVKRAKALWWNE